MVFGNVSSACLSLKFSLRLAAVEGTPAFASFFSSALLGFLQMAGASIGVVLTASIASATLGIGAVQASLTMLGLILYLAGKRAVPAR